MKSKGKKKKDVVKQHSLSQAGEDSCFQVEQSCAAVAVRSMVVTSPRGEREGRLGRVTGAACSAQALGKGFLSYAV